MGSSRLGLDFSYTIQTSIQVLGSPGLDLFYKVGEHLGSGNLILDFSYIIQLSILVGCPNLNLTY